MLLTLSVHSCVRIGKHARIRVAGQLCELERVVDNDFFQYSARHRAESADALSCVTSGYGHSSTPSGADQGSSGCSRRESIRVGNGTHCHKNVILMVVNGGKIRTKGE